MRYLLPVLLLLPAGAQDDETRLKLQHANRRLMERVEKRLASGEGSPHDPRAQADRLGYDAAKIFAFVRDEIRFEPYPGLQRGPAGVLIARAGNAGDRAWLLAELLRISGHPAKLMRGKLSKERAEELVASALKQLAARKPGRATPFGEAEVDPAKMAELFTSIGVSPAEVRSLQERMIESRRRTWREACDLTAREIQFVGGLLDGVKAGERNVHEELVEAARDHFWVRGAEDKTLDPLPGENACESESEVPDPAAIADQFRLRLQVDRMVGDKRETVPILEVKIPIPRTLSDPLYLTIQPESGEMPKVGEKISPEAAYQRLAGYSKFQAMLEIGTEVVGSKVFDYDGNVSAVKNNGQLESVGDLGGKITGFDPFGGDQPKKPKTALVSLSASFSVVRENQPVWSQSRAILEEGKRESWCPILQWSFLLQTHPYSAAFDGAMRATEHVRNSPLREKIFDWVAANGKKELDPAVFGAYRYPLDLLSYCRSYQAWLAGAASGDRMLYFDRPVVLISGRQVRLHKDKKKSCQCYGLDIVENGALVLSTEKRFEVDRKATRALGIFMTVFEEALIRNANISEEVVGTISHFEKSRAEGRTMRVLGAHEAAALVEAGIPKADVEWIGRHMRPGDQVIVAGGVSGHCHRTAWWAHEPDTGRTVGRLSTGRGGVEVAQDMSETVLHYLHIVNKVLCVLNFGVNMYQGHYGHAALGALICVVMWGSGQALHRDPTSYMNLESQFVLGILDLMCNALDTYGWASGGEH